MKTLSKLNSFKVVNLKNNNNKHNEKKIFKSDYNKEKSIIVNEFPNTKQKIVYIPMRADIIHPALINIIEKGSKLGNVVIGLLTDEAICEYTRPPQLNFKEREKIIKSVKNVSKVIPQRYLDCSNNIKRIKPDIVIHGDDWKEGFQSKIRNKVINILSRWNGELLEVSYDTKNSFDRINKISSQIGTTPERRRVTLRKLLSAKKIVRIMEVHNGLTGSISEMVNYSEDGMTKEFDCMWASSLTDATSRAKPDIEAVDISTRISTINEIFEVTTKPLIFDGDTGGLPEHLRFTIKSLERLGVSAIVIEDKTGLKKNSLLGKEVAQTQDSIENFSNKIRIAKEAQSTEDFMVIARIESLILEKGLDDAIKRAVAYVKNGADGIVIHSKKNNPKEVLDFANIYKSIGMNKPLVSIPTSYSQITEQELIEGGFKAVIYANQLIRAAYPAMESAALSILKNGRALESEQKLLGIKEILDLVPGTR